MALVVGSSMISGESGVQREHGHRGKGWIISFGYVKSHERICLCYMFRSNNNRDKVVLQEYPIDSRRDEENYSLPKEKFHPKKNVSIREKE